MKGIRYNLKFLKPNEEHIIDNLLTMKELIDTIKIQFKQNYFIEPNINNQIIYNILSRPNTSSKLLRSKLNIEKIIL